MSEDAVRRLAGLPAEIRDAEFALVARTIVASVGKVLDEAAPIDEIGFVSVSLPNGATVGTSIALTDSASLELHTLAETLSSLPAISAYLAQEAGATPLEAASLSPLSETCSAETRAAAERHSFPDGTKVQLAAGCGASLEQDDHLDLPAISPIRIRRRSIDPPATLSLWLGDPVPLSVVIAPGATVEVSPSPDGVAVALRTGVTVVDDMMRMRAGGRITETAAVLGAMSARDVLQHLEREPAASMLIGYGLLRTETPERTFAAFAEVAARRTDFADPAVLAGENSARLGRHEDALRYFVQAANTGIPAFSFGMNYMVDRLRAYASSSQGPVIKTKLKADAMVALAKVQRYAPAMLHNAVLTTYSLA